MTGPGTGARASHHWSLRIAILSVLASLPCVQMCHAATYLSGQVTDSSTNAPVSAVTLSLYSRDRGSPTPGDAPVASAQSLVNGSFLLSIPPGKLFRISIQHPGYAPLGRLLTDQDLATGTLNVTLTPQRVLRLALLDPAGQLIRGKFVELWIWSAWSGSASMLQRGFESTSDAGRVEMQSSAHDLPPSSAPLVIEANIPEVGYSHTRLDHWPESPVTLRFQEGSGLDGAIMRPGGGAASGAVVQVVRRLPEAGTADRIAEVRTGPDGAFHIDHLPPWPCSLIADVPAMGFREKVLNGTTQHVTIGPRDIPYVARLEPHGFELQTPLRVVLEVVDLERQKGMVMVSGSIRDSVTGLGLNGVVVAVLSRDRDLIDRTRTAPDGSYECWSLPDQPCTFVAAPTDHLPAIEPLIVPPGGLTRRETSLPPIPDLTLKLKRWDGASASGCRYTIVVRAASGRETKVDQLAAADGSMVMSPPDSVFLNTDSIDTAIPVSLWIYSEDAGSAAVRFDGWPDVPLIVPLSRGFALSGLVTLIGNRPAENAPVWIDFDPESSPPSHVLRTSTDNHGRFHIAGLPPGHYTVQASVAPGDLRFHGLTLKDDTDANIDPGEPGFPPV